VVAVEAIETAQELALEAVDLAADVDEVATERAVRQSVDRLGDQRINGLGQTIRLREDLRDHASMIHERMFAKQPRTHTQQRFVRSMSVCRLNIHEPPRTRSLKRGSGWCCPQHPLDNCSDNKPFHG
jgi:hypothetical protein